MQRDISHIIRSFVGDNFNEVLHILGGANQTATSAPDKDGSEPIDLVDLVEDLLVEIATFQSHPH